MYQWNVEYTKRSSTDLFLVLPAMNDDVAQDKLLLGIGVWGPRLPDPKDCVAQNRKLEKNVQELGGMKWLYAHCHYTKEDF